MLLLINQLQGLRPASFSWTLMNLLLSDLTSPLELLALLMGIAGLAVLFYRRSFTIGDIYGSDYGERG